MNRAAFIGSPKWAPLGRGDTFDVPITSIRATETEDGDLKAVVIHVCHIEMADLFNVGDTGRLAGTARIREVDNSQLYPYGLMRVTAKFLRHASLSTRPEWTVAFKPTEEPR